MRRRARELVAHAVRMQRARAWCTSTRQQPCLVSWAMSNGRMGMGKGRAKAVACGQQASCATTRAASRRSAQPRAQRAQARVPRALRTASMARAQRAPARILLPRAMSASSRAGKAGAQRAMARMDRALASERSERWLACIERWRAQRAPMRAEACDRDAAAMRRAHGLRAHGQQWLCAYGPWACNA